jgi:tetratricopeptide (TPR) repeat protein
MSRASAVLALLARLALLTLLPLHVQAQAAGRLVDALEADEQEDHVNISAVFSCSVRYISNDPVSRGDRVRIQLRLGADCGAGNGVWPTETVTVGGSSRIVSDARLEGGAAGDVRLELRWARELDFVLAPTSDGRGLRLRLLNVNSRPGRIVIGNIDEASEGYSVNLESARTPIDAATRQQAAARLRVPVYVSEVELEGTRWYRLRAGPFRTRREAEQLLLIARGIYGRAWLGINDEASNVDAVDATTPAVPVSRSTDPALPAAQLTTLQRAARSAFNQRQYPLAIELLTRLLRQPEFPERAAFQELIGLARERSSQLAQAKGEYEEYLRRYPGGPAATRIRSRLRILAASGRSPREMGLASDGRPLGWRNTGSVSELYQTGREHIDVNGRVSDRRSVNVSLTDVDWLARRHGERFDFMSRVSGGYTRDLLNKNGRSDTRVGTAYADFADRQLGLSARVGRQSHSGDGILGVFDGVLAAWQKSATLNYTAAIGFPVDTTRDGFSRERQFVALATELGPLKGVWDLGAFIVNQKLAGATDRRAVGFEGRYFSPGRTLVTLLDYDINYRQLNSLILMGNWQLPSKWVASFDLSHRHSPILLTRNALIGQPVASFRELTNLYTPQQIAQLALDRTPLSDSVALSLSRPLGLRWQFMLDAFALRIGSTPASGGVAAEPESGWDRSLQLQLSGANLFSGRDLQFFGARYQASRQARSSSVSWNGRYPLYRDWRIGPVLRAERRERFSDESIQMLYSPELRIDYSGARSLFDLYLGSEFSNRELPADMERIRRLYLLASYRYRF